MPCKSEELQLSAAAAACLVNLDSSSSARTPSAILRLLEFCALSHRRGLHEDFHTFLFAADVAMAVIGCKFLSETSMDQHPHFWPTPHA